MIREILSTIKVIAFTIGITTVIGQWFLTNYYKDKYKVKTEELKLAKQSIKDMSKQLIVSKESCKAQIKIVEFKRDVEDEIEDGVNEEKSTFKITASNGNVDNNNTTCGCKHDGTGWVFK